MRQSLAFMPYMDGGIVSFKVGLTKPDPRMFQCFWERFELRPEDCVFVDDTGENVTAARALGFQGIVFQTYDALLAELRKASVEINA